MGPLEVRVDGQPIIVDTRKALAILALLAVEDRSFARDELAALLWPESDDASARGALRRTLSVLRNGLGGGGCGSTARSWPWSATASGSTRQRSRTWVALRKRRFCEAAADYVRGPFLAGFSLRDSPDFDDWRATRAVALERAVAQLLDRVADAREVEGDTDGAVAAARRRLDLDPLDEAAHRRLMRILHSRGDGPEPSVSTEHASPFGARIGRLPTPGDFHVVRSHPRRCPRIGLLRRPSAGQDQPMPVAATPGSLPLVGRDPQLARLLAEHRSAARTDG